MSMFDATTVRYVLAYRADVPAPVYVCAHCDAPRADRVGMCLNCGSRQVAAARPHRRGRVVL